MAKKKVDEPAIETVPATIETELVETASTAILKAESPEALLKKATQIATILSNVIKTQKLFVNIKGKDYVIVEGWTTLGAMLQVFPFTEWTRQMDDYNFTTWEARVIIQTTSGQVISSGEAMCSNRESNKRSWDDYAIRSMAQTRAMGKAYRLPFAWIMALAGYEPTPYEEMENVSHSIDNQKQAIKHKSNGYTVKSPEGRKAVIDKYSEKWPINPESTKAQALKQFFGHLDAMGYDKDEARKIVGEWIKRDPDTVHFKEMDAIELQKAIAVIGYHDALHGEDRKKKEVKEPDKTPDIFGDAGYVLAPVKAVSSGMYAVITLDIVDAIPEDMTVDGCNAKEYYDRLFAVNQESDLERGKTIHNIFKEISEKLTIIFPDNLIKNLIDEGILRREP